jgi:hypothetical protein
MVMRIHLCSHLYRSHFYKSYRISRQTSTHKHTASLGVECYTIEGKNYTIHTSTFVGSFPRSAVLRLRPTLNIKETGGLRYGALQCRDRVGFHYVVNVVRKRGYEFVSALNRLFRPAVPNHFPCYAVDNINN